MSVPDDLCPRCGAQKDEGDTMCIDCIFENAPDTQAEMTRLTAALAQSRAETQAALAGCIKIKPLVWEPVSSKICEAVGSSGLYRVTWRDDGTAWLHTPLNGTIKYSSPNEAIVAAENIHKNGILAAIQPDTSKLALVREAFGNLVNHDVFQDEEYLSRDLAAKLNAARSALAIIAAQEGE